MQRARKRLRSVVKLSNIISLAKNWGRRGKLGVTLGKLGVLNGVAFALLAPHVLPPMHCICETLVAGRIPGYRTEAQGVRLPNIGGILRLLG